MSLNAKKRYPSVYHNLFNTFVTDLILIIRAMKKVFITLCFLTVMLAVSSCRSVEKALPLSSISGEWTIIEINGAKVVTGENGIVPFIVFDTKTGRISGNSGCNRMMGSFDLNAEAGSLLISGMGSTRMMCPDMTTERNVLNALKQVKSYRKAGEGTMYLCNEKNRPVMLLSQKAPADISALSGEWKIAEVNGEIVPSGLEKQPFLAFDMEKQTVHGNAGCNLVNGGFETKMDNPRAISFPRLATTMMACPDMELESKILKALNEVKSFDVVGNDEIALYGEDNARLLLLKK